MVHRTFSLQHTYDLLCTEVAGCRRCKRMEASARVLSRAAGRLDSPVMFIGEAPGRLGADGSEIPFHGDKAGHNFEDLLEFSGFTRADIFVTNAVLCNPRDLDGNNSTPTSEEITNCSQYLRRQIDLVDPSIVVTLGATALKAVSNIESHALTLRESVRTSVKWNGRILIPLYHPGQRALMSRNMEVQRADYAFVRTQYELQCATKAPDACQDESIPVAVLARALAESVPDLTYFALHKLTYLFELAQVRKYGRQTTKAFFIRQLDGPYCVNLHYKKLAKMGLIVVGKGVDGLRVTVSSRGDLFASETEGIRLPDAVRSDLGEVVQKYRDLNHADLKRHAYLSAPMRSILREEKSLNKQLLNVPLDLAEITPRRVGRH